MTRNKLKVWVVDDDDSIRWVLERALSGGGMEVSAFVGGIECLDALKDSEPPQVLVTDIRMRGIDGFALIDRIREKLPKLPIIIMTAHSDLESAVSAYQAGAFEYLPKPFDVDDVIELVERAAATVSESAAVPQAQGPAMIGEAPAMQEVFRAIGRLSKSDISVLITGESGTGKELVAQSLHGNSPRAKNPFIAINTAAIPKELMESEFFGHERGAFTGANTQRIGRFEQANGGTLFLDEIGEMPADLQTRLLRVLADGQFYRVGGHTPVKVNVRIIAATNQDLEAAVVDGSFRDDLFHRLNVIRIRMPALNERREDIPALLHHFMARSARELDAEAKSLRPEVVKRLSQLDWPGNVRQLENVCRWLTVMAPGTEIHMADLPPDLPSVSKKTASPVVVPTEASGDWRSELAAWSRAQFQQGQTGLFDEVSKSVDRLLIDAALEHTGGRKQEAAQLLGWGRNTLTRKLKDLG